jgi:hypothetical protein
MKHQKKITIRTPGLGWFAHVVRGAVLGCLDSLSLDSAIPDEHLIVELAAEKAMIKIKLKKDMKAGQAVTFSDIEYR